MKETIIRVPDDSLGGTMTIVHAANSGWGIGIKVRTFDLQRLISSDTNIMDFTDEAEATQ